MVPTAPWYINDIATASQSEGVHELGDLLDAQSHAGGDRARDDQQEAVIICPELFDPICKLETGEPLHFEV